MQNEVQTQWKYLNAEKKSDGKACKSGPRLDLHGNIGMNSNKHASTGIAQVV